MDQPDDNPGQLKAGYNMTARDLDRAFVAAKFSSLQLLLIQQARELSWSLARIKGSPTPIPFRFHFASLSRSTHSSRTSLIRLFNDLVACRVFVKLCDGTFIINKDYRQWLHTSGRHRLSPNQLDWCREIRRKKLPKDKKNFKPSKPPGIAIDSSSSTSTNSQQHCIPTETKCIPTETPPVSQRIQNCIPTETELYPNGDRVVSQRRQTHSIGTRLESFNESFNGEGESVPPPPISAAPQRTPEDATLVAKAASMLCSDLRTEHLGIELRRLDGLPDMLAIPGWKWVRAAERILSPDIPDAKRRRWPYFFAIARSITDDERNAPAKPTRNGRHPAPVPLPPPAREVTNGRHVNLVPPRPRSKPDSRKEPDARD